MSKMLTKNRQHVLTNYEWYNDRYNLSELTQEEAAKKLTDELGVKVSIFCIRESREKYNLPMGRVKKEGSSTLHQFQARRKHRPVFGRRGDLWKFVAYLLFVESMSDNEAFTLTVKEYKQRAANQDYHCKLGEPETRVLTAMGLAKEKKRRGEYNVEQAKQTEQMKKTLDVKSATGFSPEAVFTGDMKVSEDTGAGKVNIEERPFTSTPKINLNSHINHWMHPVLIALLEDLCDNEIPCPKTMALFTE